MKPSPSKCIPIDLLLVGGPPRSGTTLLTKILNSHPAIITQIDNNVYESWGLYFYRNRTGLIEKLRIGGINTPELAEEHLYKHLVQGDALFGIASGPLTKQYSKVPPPKAHIFPNRSWKRKIKFLFEVLIGRREMNSPATHRRLIPLNDLEQFSYLCLKSPEIVFEIPKLSFLFPEATFIFVYRPIQEIAESMYRKGFQWKLASYHRRWKNEVDENGKSIVPPGVYKEWTHLWENATDFQRCIIYATSYIRALAEGIHQLHPNRMFLYNHTDLRKNPQSILIPIANFLGISPDNFSRHLIAKIVSKPSSMPLELRNEYKAFHYLLDTKKWLKILQIHNIL